MGPVGLEGLGGGGVGAAAVKAMARSQHVLYMGPFPFTRLIVLSGDSFDLYLFISKLNGSNITQNPNSLSGVPSSHHSSIPHPTLKNLTTPINACYVIGTYPPATITQVPRHTAMP